MLTIDNIIDMIRSNSSKVVLPENSSVIKIYSEKLVTEVWPAKDIHGVGGVGYEVRGEISSITSGKIPNVSWEILLNIAQEKNNEDVKNLIFSEYGID